MCPMLCCYPVREPGVYSFDIAAPGAYAFERAARSSQQHPGIIPREFFQGTGVIENSMSQSKTVSQPVSFSSASAMPSARQSRRALILEVGLPGGILLLALLLRLWHLDAVTDNYDEGVYWASLRAMREGYGLFTPVFSSQPPFFLLSLYPLVALLGPTLYAARLGIVGFSLISVLAMYVLARRLGGPWAGGIAALLLACDYLYLIQSQTVQAEAPSVALMIVALAAASYANRYPWQAAGISGIATALAILEKLFAVAAIPPIAVLFAGQLMAFERALPGAERPATPGAGLSGRLRLPQRATIRRAGLLAGTYLLGLVLAGLLVMLPYLGQLQTAYQQVIAFHLAADQSFASTTSQNPSILLGAHPMYPLAVLALLGLMIGLLRRRWHVLTAGAWILAALIILLRQAPLFTHHLVLLIPGLALSAAIGLAPAGWRLKPRLEVPPQSLASQAETHARAVWGRQALLVGLPLLLVLGVILYDLRDVRNYPLGPVANAAQISQVADDLASFTTSAQQVITDDQYIAMLANRDVPPALVDTSNVRITTGYLTTAQVEAIAEQPQIGAILFYSGRFDELSGFRAWVTQHFQLARDYVNGRDLYVRIAS